MSKYVYAVAFLLLFIPLYPKLPLFSPLPSYIVRIRLEDILVALTTLWFIVQLIGRKVSVPKTFIKLVTVYTTAGLISLLAALFVSPTIPQVPDHVLKSLLHWLRYLEYFILGVLVYAAAKTPRARRFLVHSLIVASILANLYGIGQKYLSWPAFSTMNIEYSKGIPLILGSSAARVQSTFAGHYDYAGFLVILTPLSLALLLSQKRSPLMALYALAYGLNLWGLMVSASRSGVAGVFLGLGLVCVLAGFTGTITRDYMVVTGKRLGFLAVSLALALLLFGANFTALIGHTLAGFLPQDSRILQLLDGGATVDQYAAPQPARQLPPDVYVDQPEQVEQVVVDEDGKVRVVLESRAREYSECAARRGLSVCIRLEALWPQAWAGFYHNPLLGSGYGTLNKQDFYEFTEADSTDNNFLRILGETGILGLVSFLAIIGYVSLLSLKQIISSRRLSRTLAIAWLAATIGLLVNALYIDVYAASKIAFTYWALAGLVLAGVLVKRK